MSVQNGIGDPSTMTKGQELALRLIVHEVITMLDDLHGVVMEMGEFADTVKHRRKFINQQKKLLRLLAQFTDDTASPLDELHDRVCELEDLERAREEDKQRPVEIIISKRAG